MFEKLKTEFNKDFTITKSYDKVCTIYGSLTFPLMMMYILLKLISEGAGMTYTILKSLGFFNI